MKPTFALSLAMALTIGLAGCGQPGPLYLPKPPAKPATAAATPATPVSSSPAPSTPT